MGTYLPVPRHGPSHPITLLRFLGLVSRAESHAADEPDEVDPRRGEGGVFFDTWTACYAPTPEISTSISVELQVLDIVAAILLTQNA